jgi:DNA polymerase-1
MRYLTFATPESSSYDICFLVPQLHRADMERIYVTPHLAGLEAEILAYDLHKGAKRTPVTEQREYLAELLPVLKDLKTRYLVTCDAEYFKTLTKLPKAEDALGYVYPCQIEGFDFYVLYCPNFRTVFYNPEKVNTEIGLALKALVSHRDGSYIAPGKDIIKFAAYPSTVGEIETWLNRLLEMDCPLASDIETFSLKHYSAGIGTIAFAWSKHEGIAFAVDLLPTYEERIKVRSLLRDFFRSYAATGHKMRWHNISFDVYVLIYQLYMKDLLDIEGLYHGMDILLSHWDCTKLITYLATNSCAGNQLGLKAQAVEFAGKYAVEDIEDIRQIPLPELLEYNLIDTLATHYVYEKHWDTLVADQQLDIYENLFKPAILDIIQMQLTGLPLDRDEVLKVQHELRIESNDAMSRLEANQKIQEFLHDETEQAWERDYEDRRSKAKHPENIKRKDRATFPDVTINPNSPLQLQRLLYDMLGLPVIDLTDTKAPATGGKTLKKLLDHPNAKHPNVQALLEALIDYKAVDKLLTAFIPAMLEAPQGPDGHHYLFGNFNLGGTVSGRLSSSGPNLQNLPAKGKLAKLIKRCFKAPPGWLFVGLDFASLEDRISALTTKDPNKLKVYTDGYDGHSLRAYSYYAEAMPDIDPTSVESINSIADKYPDLRSDSKGPTFLLTYGGTFHGMMRQFGMDEERAQLIEWRYHDLYRVSDEWVAEKIQEASQTGYVTVAFGLRVRTPKLRQTLLGNSRTPYEAEAEGRTAGNALGQSWCLLNSRAGSEFMAKVRKSRFWRTIRPCAQIHDAGYFLIRDDMAELLFTNEHLVEAVNWQDHPDIYHPDVGLGGELSIFYPSWNEECVIPNNATPEQIKTLAVQHYEKYCCDPAEKAA